MQSIFTFKSLLLISILALFSACNTSTLNRSVSLADNASNSNIAKSKAFITTWKTDNPGATDANQIHISTKNESYSYDYQVNWGDGSSDTHVTRGITHTYAAPGTYTVEIRGQFPKLHFDYYSDNQKLLSVEQWGDIQWQSMHRAFSFCKNMVINATDAPNLSQVTDMSYMFAYAEAFNQLIDHWDVSSVTNMSDLFYEASTFNQPLDSWDVSSVTNMSEMFAHASAFNQPLNSWNVSSVKNMTCMFDGAYSFNQTIEDWDVSAVTDMSVMFYDAKAFNQPLNNWNVSSVSTMNGMFQGAEAFNQALDKWDLSSVTITSWMFERAKLFDQSLDSWDITSVSDMNDMFTGTSLSTENYDALLISWAGQAVKSHVDFGAWNTQYTEGGAAESARSVLENTYSWNITDGGASTP